MREDGNRFRCEVSGQVSGLGLRCRENLSTRYVRSETPLTPET